MLEGNEGVKTEETPVDAPKVETQTGQGNDDHLFDGEVDPARVKQLITNIREGERKAKQERTQAATELAEAQRKLKAYEDEKLTEQERIQRDLKDKDGKLSSYEQRVRDLSVKNAVLEEAVALNIVSPKQAAKLLEPAKLKFDDEGNVTNIREQLDELLKESPWLIKGATAETPKHEAPNTPPANPARTDTTKPVFTRAQLNDYKFFKDNEAAITAAVREGRISA